MDSLDLDTARLKAVLTMFQISQGELARSAGISTAMLSLTLAGKKRPSARLVVAMIYRLGETTHSWPSAGLDLLREHGRSFRQRLSDSGSRQQPVNGDRARSDNRQLLHSSLISTDFLGS